MADWMAGAMRAERQRLGEIMGGAGSRRVYDRALEVAARWSDEPSRVAARTVDRLGQDSSPTRTDLVAAVEDILAAEPALRRAPRVSGGPDRATVDHAGRALFGPTWDGDDAA
jgi:hypothetical protein